MRRPIIAVVLLAAFVLGSAAAAGLAFAAPELWSRIAPEDDGWPDCSNCGPNGAG